MNEATNRLLTVGVRLVHFINNAVSSQPAPFPCALCSRFLLGLVVGEKGLFCFVRTNLNLTLTKYQNRYS